MKGLLAMLVVAGLLVLGGLAQGAKGECEPGQGEMVCLAQNGDVDAQYAYGVALLNGDGVEEDRMEALKWLDLAAKGGHTAARQMLATMSLSTQPGEFCGGKN